MTAPEAQLLFARVLVVALLYLFLGLVGLAAWRDLSHARRRPREPATSGPQPRLIMIEPAESDRAAGAAFVLLAVTAVGRDMDCELVLADPTVSARHAVVVAGADGWYAEDLTSTNGTFVAGERLPPHRPVPLRSGDLVQFGAVQLRFVLPSPPGDPSTARRDR